MNSAEVVRQCDVTQAMLGAVSAGFFSHVDHRGGIGGLRSSDRNSATTRDCTAPVRALFVGCMETKQLSQYPYEKAKFRHNLHKRPAAVLWASVTPNGLWPGWKRKD